MNYYLFLDESGDHGIKNIDFNFPVFVLCGIIISQSGYESLNMSFNKIKHNFWGDSKVIFHSRDIRKCEKEFKILLNNDVKLYFVDKKENINGLQLSDLVAYPIARFCMDKNRANPAFDFYMFA